MPQVIQVHSENNVYQHLDVLKRNRQKRTQYGECIVEGVTAINLLLKYNWEIVSWVYSFENPLSSWATSILEKSTAITHIELSQSLMEKLSDKENTSELLAVVKQKKQTLDEQHVDKNSLFVLLDRPSSPGNLGTIIRSCSSFGATAIFILGHAADMYDAKAIQASIGTVFTIPILKVESLEQFTSWVQDKKSTVHLSVIGTSAKADDVISTILYPRPVLLVVGNETTGLSAGLKELCDKLVKIPMVGEASSLNIGCATSIFLYEVTRQS